MMAQLIESEEVSQLLVYQSKHDGVKYRTILSVNPNLEAPGSPNGQREEIISPTLQVYVHELTEEMLLAIHLFIYLLCLSRQTRFCVDAKLSCGNSQVQ